MRLNRASPVQLQRSPGRFKSRGNNEIAVRSTLFLWRLSTGEAGALCAPSPNPSVNGGFTVWLCQTAAKSAPAAVAGITPVCSSPAFSSSGIITAATIVGPAARSNRVLGELAELATALQAGVA